MLICLKRLCALNRFVIPSKIGGSSTDGIYERYITFANSSLLALSANPPTGTTIVTSADQTKKVMEILMKETKNKIVAWDTQTIDLDIKRQTPVGAGRVICLSAFAGPHINFGNGPRLFIDNFGTNSGNLLLLRQYFQSQQYLKAFHNFSFDRHIIQNHGLNLKGFGADTMHMARLFDPSLAPGMYSLSSLTQIYKKKLQQYRQQLIEQLIKKYQSQQQKINTLKQYKQLMMNNSLKKQSIQKLFTKKKILKSGSQGKSYVLPTTITLHTNPQYIKQWVQYSVLDAQATYFLRYTLEKFLKIQKSSAWATLPNMYQLYIKYWKPFGQILTNMQKSGITVNKAHLQVIKQKAITDLKNSEKKFIDFLKTFQDGSIQNFNLASIQQLQQLLHAPFKRKSISKSEQEQILQQQLQRNQIQTDILTRKQVNRTVIHQFPQLAQLKIPNPLEKPATTIIRIRGLGINPLAYTITGLPSVDYTRIKLLAGNPKEGKFGKAFQHFKGTSKQQFGKNLCFALIQLINYKQTNTLLKTFIQPLIQRVDEDGRIHCSLNLNTQTGRISSRKPNLQNQPALDKDRYKIRQAFIAQKGKKFIVADYGQLQLRVLAHMTGCKSMINDFGHGGDFHSRTAASMFPNLKQQIQTGKLLLQRKGDNKDNIPLLKQKYPNQRKKAKTMNFSIAYGKTVQGFAQDWNCSIQQAKQYLQAWYKQRKQVKKWQIQRKKIAEIRYYSQTLLGRYRFLHKFFRSSKFGMKSMGYRRAINNPIQGGAADIVVGAMIKLANDQKLLKLGWYMLLQIHDQVIMQGPQQSANEALERVKYVMQNPLDQKLLLNLQVDAKIGDNWYQCK